MQDEGKKNEVLLDTPWGTRNQIRPVFTHAPSVVRSSLWPIRITSAGSTELQRPFAFIPSSDSTHQLPPPRPAAAADAAPQRPISRQHAGGLPQGPLQETIPLPGGSSKGHQNHLCPTAGNIFSREPARDDTYEELVEIQPRHQHFCVLALVI